MKQKVCLVAVAALAMAANAMGKPLDGLRFLLGTWSGGAATAPATDAFQLELDGHVLQRHSRSTVRTLAGRPAGSMRALLIIYSSSEENGLRALYVDNTGHSIQYDDVTVVAGTQLELRSSGSSKTPSFRLTYSLKSTSTLHVKFEMLPPGHDAYQVIAEADENRNP